MALRRIISWVLVALVAMGPLASISSPACAEGGGLSIIRDAEAEALIADYARPILKAAGLGTADIRVTIINNDSFNAFVADSRHIFINAGTIMDTDLPNELIGVIAHETGHLAGNHLEQIRERLRNMQIFAVAAMLGGAAAAAAGQGQAGVATALAGTHLAERSVLYYARSQETSADRAALTFLEKTGQSAKGMITTFQKLTKLQNFAVHNADPYVQTHPLPPDRIAMVEDVAKSSKYFNAVDSPALIARHQMVRAKFIGFTRTQRDMLRAFPLSDNSLAARYARAVQAYRFKNKDGALKEVDDLLRVQPANPYFYELKAQILTGTGRMMEAVAPMRKAASLSANTPQLTSGLGQILVQTGDDHLLPEAIRLLERATKQDREDSGGWQQLAIAYARQGQVGKADLATAEQLFEQGAIFDAQVKANQAKRAFKVGTPEWLRADDIASTKDPKDR